MFELEFNKLASRLRVNLAGGISLFSLQEDWGCEGDEHEGVEVFRVLDVLLAPVHVLHAGVRELIAHDLEDGFVLALGRLDDSQVEEGGC